MAAATAGEDDGEAAAAAASVGARDRPVAVARLHVESGMLDRIRSAVPKESLEENHAAVLTAVDAAILEWLRRCREEREREGAEGGGAGGGGEQRLRGFEDLRVSCDLHVGPMLKSRGFVDLDTASDAALDLAALARLGGKSGSIPSQQAHLGLAIECYKSLTAAPDISSLQDAIISSSSGTFTPPSASAAIASSLASSLSSSPSASSGSNASPPPAPSSSVSLTSLAARSNAQEVLRLLKDEPPPPPPSDDEDDSEQSEEGRPVSVLEAMLQADKDPWKGGKIR